MGDSRSNSAGVSLLSTSHKKRRKNINFKKSKHSAQKGLRAPFTDVLVKLMLH